MPNTAKTTAAKLENFSKEFKEEGIVIAPNSTSSNAPKLLCRYCGSFVVMKRFSITQHINTQGHQKKKEKKIKFQQLDDVCTQSKFSSDLCRVGSPAIYIDHWFLLQ
jgi:hypothetical protein